MEPLFALIGMLNTGTYRWLTNRTDLPGYILHRRPAWGGGGYNRGSLVCPWISRNLTGLILLHQWMAQLWRAGMVLIPFFLCSIFKDSRPLSIPFSQQRCVPWYPSDICTYICKWFPSFFIRFVCMCCGLGLLRIRHVSFGFSLCVWACVLHPVYKTLMHGKMHDAWEIWQYIWGTNIWGEKG